MKAEKIEPAEILRRRAQNGENVDEAVGAILRDVREGGDEALLNYARRFDGADLTGLAVCAEELDGAVQAVGADFCAVLREAAQNLRDFHQMQVRQGFIKTDRPGIVMGQKIIPLDTVGVYVPGGTAAYPSTVLMDTVPARIAGVKRIVMVTPPGKDGKVNDAVLAAARIAGVTEIYKIGGAQAIAALCYGTESVPKVDKIVGPGNMYVAAAKRMVYGLVDVDMIAGPSDVLVVADESAEPHFVAADMLAQAEHDANAAAVLITTVPELAEQVKLELKKQLPVLPRKETAEKSLTKNGLILLAESLEKAIETANALAPEHLELCVEEPLKYLSLVQNAGSVFLGNYTPEALGDYFAGPNHTLPTGGSARFYSPLSVDDFIKKSSYLYYSRQALREAGEKVRDFALREGLGAHANSISIRTEQ